MFKRPGIFRRVKKDALYSRQSASQETTTSSRLEGLPTEMIEEIIKHISMKDLKSFRRTSKACNYKGLKHFSNVCFENVHLLTCHEQSIVNAISVAQHPQFGTSIRSLEIALFVAPDPWTWVPWKARGNALTSSQWSYLQPMHAQQSLMLDHGLLKEHLKLLLGILKREGKLCKITLPQLDIENDARLSVLRNAGLMHWEGNHQHFGGDKVYDQMLNTVLEVLGAAAIHLDELNLEQLGYQPLSYHIDGHMLLERLPSAMASVRHIEISLKNLYRRTDEDYIGFCDGFASVLASMNLQSLKLNIAYDKKCRRRFRRTGRAIQPRFEASDIVAAMLKQTFPDLRMLVLHGPAIAIPDLTTFIEKQSKLKSMRFECVRFVGSDGDAAELKEVKLVDMVFEDCLNWMD